jgi:hypothetical protein
MEEMGMTDGGTTVWGKAAGGFSGVRRIGSLALERGSMGAFQ